MLPRYRFVVILLLAVAAHAQDPCNPPTACRDVLTVNGSGNTAIVKTTDRIDRYTREYILLSPSADGPREFARITSGEGDGLQALYVDRQGFLLESQSEKSQPPTHWWIDWPTPSKPKPTVTQWKAYLLYEGIEYRGETYYFATNGLRSIFLHNTRPSGFAVVTEALSETLRASLPSPLRDFEQTPYGPGPPGRPRKAHTSIRSGAAQCSILSGGPFAEVKDPPTFLRRVGSKVTRKVVHPGTLAEYREQRAQEFAEREGAVELSQIAVAIGPVQIEGSRLWFGRQFYNGEGSTGIGGFGYYDCATDELREYTIPQSSPYSAIALWVDTDTIWLSLARYGEYGMWEGGLLEWNREKETARHWKQMPYISHIVRDGADLVFLSDTSILVKRGDVWNQVFVRELPSGKVTVLHQRHSPVLPKP